MLLYELCLERKLQFSELQEYSKGEKLNNVFKKITQENCSFAYINAERKNGNVTTP